MARYAVESAHVQFFRDHGFVEFEDLLDAGQIESLREAVYGSLSRRAACKPYEVDGRPNDQLLQLGRGLSSENEVLRRTVRSKRLAEVAAALCNAQVLHLGYDQAFVSGRSFQSKHLTNAASLEELSSCQGQACALLLNLGEEAGSAAPVPGEGSEACNVFTQVPGNAVLISPQLPINWDLLLHRTDACYFLIAYVGGKGRYLKNPRDWAPSSWVDAGYANGDVLDPEHHPRLWQLG